MADKLILPAWIISEFLMGFRCKRCGGKVLTCTLLYPRMRMLASHVELVYPLRCPCGGADSVKVRLPTLLLGLVLVHIALVEAHRQAGRSKATMIAFPLPSKILAQVRNQYAQLVGELRKTSAGAAAGSRPDGEDDATSAPPAGPSDAMLPGKHTPPDRPLPIERVLFNLSEEEWRAMLRRMGFETGEVPPEGAADEGAEQ